jgi:hypothetical protein
VPYASPHQRDKILQVTVIVKSLFWKTLTAGVGAKQGKFAYALFMDNAAVNH